jgi:hypothetical protein
MGVSDSVMAITKVVSANARGMVVGAGFITKHNFCHNHVDTITAFLCRVLNRDLIVFLGGGEHSMSEDSLVVIIEIAFQETNCMHFVDLIVAPCFLE